MSPNPQQFEQASMLSETTPEQHSQVVAEKTTTCACSNSIMLVILHILVPLFFVSLHSLLHLYDLRYISWPTLHRTEYSAKLKILIFLDVWYRVDAIPWKFCELTVLTVASA